MDKKYFRARFNYKVDEAKSNYSKSISEGRRKELAELKEKIISEAQEKFLESIPTSIAPGEKCKIKYEIKVERDNEGYDDILYKIKGSSFGSSDQVVGFIYDIASELSEMLGREICSHQENWYMNCTRYVLSFYI